MYLPAQHRDLVAEYQEVDVFGAAVAGELGQHLQHLAQKQVYQRSAHGPGSLELPRRRLGSDPHVNPAEPDLRARQAAAWRSDSITAVAVAVAVEMVDVSADHLHRPFDIGWAVPAAAGAIDVTGDWHAGSAVVRIALLFFFRAVRCHLGYWRRRDLLTQEFLVSLHTIG
jgi:hypothetical protein